MSERLLHSTYCMSSEPGNISDFEHGTDTTSSPSTADSELYTNSIGVATIQGDTDITNDESIVVDVVSTNLEENENRVQSKSSAKNPKPCASCTLAKKKCVLITSPDGSSLCERCKKKKQTCRIHVKYKDVMKHGLEGAERLAQSEAPESLRFVPYEPVC